MPETSPFIPFRFRASLFSGDPAGALPDDVLCAGAFSEVSGLEATMAPKTFKEGGRNYGEIHRTGPTTFATIVLKRGITSVDHLATWFDVVTRRENYGHRMAGRIDLIDGVEDGEDRIAVSWRIRNAMPTKLKGPDLSATASSVAIEELHLVHEGFEVVRGGAG